MCNCPKGIQIGSYDNTALAGHPRWASKYIYVDKCLVDEIRYLWKCGVITTGCCCGHNIVEPMINVHEDSERLMSDLGYSYKINKFNVKCYKPKTL